MQRSFSSRSGGGSGAGGAGGGGGGGGSSLFNAHGRAASGSSSSSSSSSSSRAAAAVATVAVAAGGAGVGGGIDGGGESSSFKMMMPSSSSTSMSTSSSSLSYRSGHGRHVEFGKEDDEQQEQGAYFENGLDDGGDDDTDRDVDEVDHEGEEEEIEEYVVALHDYAPPDPPPPSSSTASSTSSSSHEAKQQQQQQVYLGFAAGDRIRVWNRHPSGWWDGEIVVDDVDVAPGTTGGGGKRGWFPSNFVTEWRGGDRRGEEATTDEGEDEGWAPAAAGRPTGGSISSSAASGSSMHGIHQRFDRDRRAADGKSVGGRWNAQAIGGGGGGGGGESRSGSGSGSGRGGRRERGGLPWGSSGSHGSGGGGGGDREFNFRGGGGDVADGPSNTNHHRGTSSTDSDALIGGGGGDADYDIPKPQRAAPPPPLATMTSTRSPFSVPEASSASSTSSITRHSASTSLTSLQTTLPPHAFSVLEPIEQAVQLVRTAASNRRRSHYQPSTACVISAIRSLLAATGCLSRESELLSRVSALQRVRKTILADLADLVALAKAASAQDAEGETETQGMLAAAQGTLEDVKTFLEVLVRHGVDLPERKDVKYPLRPILTTTESTAVLRSSPVEHIASASDPLEGRHRTQPGRMRERQMVPTRSLDEMRLAAVPPRRPHGDSVSSMSSSTDSSNEDIPSGLPLLDGRLDVVTALGQTEESLFSVIAALIGHIHSHDSTSHPSSHALLIDLTRETIDKVRDLLTLVEATTRNPNVERVHATQVAHLHVAKAGVYEITGKLVECAELVASKTHVGLGDDEAKAELLSLATATLRTASECSRLVRVCVRKPGSRDTFDIDVDVPGRRPLVGERGEHTLSALGRKADGLGSLQQQYERDGLMSPAIIEPRRFYDDDEEEEMMTTHSDEDVTMRPRPKLRSNQTSPVLPGRGAALDPRERARHRSTSMSSPSQTPKLMPRRSPSKSADLNAVITSGDLSFVKTPRPASRQDDDNHETPKSGEYDARFWLVSHDHHPKDVAFASDGALMGATLDVLVEKLTPHDTLVDPAFLDTFFLTFRLFTTATKLLQALEVRFDLSPPHSMPINDATIRLWNERKLTPIRLRVLNFLRLWLDAHWKKEDGEAIQPMLDFVDERLCKAFPNDSPRLRDQIVKLRDGQQPVKKHSRKLSKTFSPTASSAPPPPPTPILNRALFGALRSGAKGIVITDFDALELARQLTLMESALFQAIAPEDLLQTGRRKVASLTAMSTLSNRITGWVADSILDETDPKRRAALLKFFIKLSARCLELNNFSTLFALLAGLNSSTILRLKKTWDALAPKYRHLMDRLRVLIEHSRNHREYRQRLKEANLPALPFLGLILTDITFTSDGNQNFRPSTVDPDVKLINYDKYIKLARIASDFERYQTPYNLAAVSDVQAWLERVLAEKGSGSVDALYRKSRK